MNWPIVLAGIGLVYLAIGIALAWLTGRMFHGDVTPREYLYVALCWPRGLLP